MRPVFQMLQMAQILQMRRTAWSLRRGAGVIDWRRDRARPALMTLAVPTAAPRVASAVNSLLIVLLIALLGGVLLGCGAPPIERLHGEPKAAARYTKVRPVDPPVAEAVNRFIAAVRRGAVEEANESLSRATRMALEVRARTVGLRGVDLLRKPGPAVSKSARRLFIADPIAAFTLKNLKTIRVGERPWPVNKPHDGRTLLWAVELIDRAGHSRIITLRFEQIAWRIHNPRLRSK